MSVKNSSRVFGSSRNTPNIVLVTVLLFIFCTPRITIHMCLEETRGTSINQTYSQKPCHEDNRWFLQGHIKYGGSKNLQIQHGHLSKSMDLSYSLEEIKFSAPEHCLLSLDPYKIPIFPAWSQGRACC